MKFEVGLLRVHREVSTVKKVFDKFYGWGKH